MNWMVSLLIVLQVISALAIVILVLLQHGKGADMGAAFGSGASGSLFGATGSANFLSRATGVVAAVFFVVTLSLAYLGWRSPHTSSDGGVMSTTPPPAVTTSVPKDVPVPAATTTSPPAPNAAPKSSEIPK